MPIMDLKTGKIERTQVENVKFYLSQVKDWAVTTVRDTVEYVKENPQKAVTIVGLIGTVTGGAAKLVRSVNRHQAIRQEKWHRDREIYDHSSKQYLTTKRKLTKTDIDRMNKLRREEGLKVSEALSRLNLLK